MNEKKNFVGSQHWSNWMMSGNSMQIWFFVDAHTYSQANTNWWLIYENAMRCGVTASKNKHFSRYWKEKKFPSSSIREKKNSFLFCLVPSLENQIDIKFAYFFSTPTVDYFNISFTRQFFFFFFQFFSHLFLCHFTLENACKQELKKAAQMKVWE